MMTVEPIQNFDGFGIGQSASEYFYSQGMCRTQFGLTPGWYATDDATSIGLSGLGVVRAFSADSNKVYGLDDNGIVYSVALSLTNWVSAYAPLQPNVGNGLIVDQTNRVLVAGNRYLSKWDGATPNYITGSVQLTVSSTAVLGVGTTFTAGMVGKQIVFQQQAGVIYTIASFIDATHITLNTAFTGSSTSSNYTIYMGSTEQWKDFGSGYSSSAFRPMDLYEDWVVMGNGNAISLLNVTDDSFNNIGLSLPSGYKVAALRSGLSGILVGVNINSRGAIFLWDASANGSISQWIWFNDNIKAIVPTNEGSYGYFVVTSRGIYKTNGYVISPLYEQMPDDRLNSGNILSTVTAQGAVLIGKYLMFFGGSGGFNRNRGGLFIFNTDTQLFEFCPVSNQVQTNITMGALYYDSTFRIRGAYSSSKPSVKAIASVFNGSPPSAYYITEQKGTIATPTSSPANIKTAQAAKWTITQSPKQVANTTSTFKVAVKIYTFLRPLWNVVQTASISSAANSLTINGTIYVSVAQTGDEVTVLEGVNAGQVAHITGITSPGTSSEVWTLDTSFSGGDTEQSVSVSIAPFKLVQSFTFSNVAQLRDLYFDIKNKLVGKRFLLKFLLTGISGSELDISDGQFIYDDQGVITS